jgi:hypothetical protein
VHEVEPIDHLPEWGEWGDERHVAVLCKTCRCVYTGRYLSPYGPGGKPVQLGGVPKSCISCARTRREAARQSLAARPELIEAVKRHAAEHYDEDGWDVIVECYEDLEIWQVIAGAQTAAEAISKMRAVAKLHDERQRDIGGTAW